MLAGQRFYQTFKRLSLAVICMVVAACGNPAPSGYFPLEAGLSWTYKRSQALPKQVRPNVNVFTIKNTGTDEIKNGDVSHAVFIRRTGDGTDYYLSDTDAGIMRVAKRTVIEIKPRFDENLRTVLPSEEKLAVGYIWNVETGPYMLRTRPGFIADLSDKRFKMSFEVLELNSTVDVPAGRFEDCLKIEGYSSVRLYADPRTGYVDVPITQTEWYAPGVGMVKLVRDEPIDGSFYVGGTISMELEKFEY